MTQEFVPYEQSLELKELGFDEYCMGACYYEFKDKGKTCMLLNTPDSYNSEEGVKAPLYQQAFRWFRERYGYNCFIVSTKTGKWFYYREDLNDLKNDSEPELTPKFDTYEEAELDCIIKLIEIVKNK